MEEHDDASLMLAEDDHHMSHPRHEDDENDEDEEHEMHHGEEDDDEDEDEHMDIEPNRIEGVSGSLDRDDFLDVDPTKEQIWEVRIFVVSQKKIEYLFLIVGIPSCSVVFRAGFGKNCHVKMMDSTFSFDLNTSISFDSIHILTTCASFTLH